MISLTAISKSSPIRARKQWLKSRLGAAYKFWADRFRSYDAGDLHVLLSHMGVSAGDCVLMHSSFRPTNGFQGKPQDIIDVVLDLIGLRGTLVMMSMAYESSTKQYLSTRPIFDVRRTPSRMGILTELFRRRQGVVRSLSPTHPIVALGEKAAWIVEGHDRCAYPCGPGSPFQKILELDAKMFFFDLPFVGFTFVHYIEHQIQEYLPFPLYEPAPMTALLRDYNGKTDELSVYVFAEEAVRRRNVEVITDRMHREGTAGWRRIGNTRIVLARTSDALTTGVRLAASGILPFNREA